MPVKRSNISYADWSGADCNIVLGCTRASAGCDNCYARAITERAGKDFSQVCTYPDKLRRLSTAKFDPKGVPFRRGERSRPIAFVCDMSDLFHPSVEARFIINALMVLATERKDVDWLILTKRAKRMLDITKYMTETWEFKNDVLPKHLWFGVTVEDNRVTERAYWLRQAPVSVRWLSVEPMLEPIDVELSGIRWVVCGGESGPHRREFNKTWALQLWHKCQEAGVAFWFKQGSALLPGQDNLLAGRIVQEYPQP